jgi:uncharacterized protein
MDKPSMQPNPELPLGGLREPQVREPSDAVSAISVALGEGPEDELTMLLDAQEFFIPVHGFVRLTLQEVSVMNHPALQRLGTIYQLGQAHLVFRGATHSRLEHCVGAVHVAEVMISAINFNLARIRRASSVGAPAARPLSEVERKFIRLAALAHDIGHLPAGHTLEDELGVLDRHDLFPRLSLVLDRTSWPGGEAESLRTVIDREFGASAEVTASEILTEIIGGKWEPDTDAERSKVQARKAAVEKVVRLSVCRDLVGNTICADLLDYLYRDWYHVGKPHYFESRLLQYMEIRTDRDGVDRFVISLGRLPKLRTDAVSAILRLLEMRYELAETVLFHRTKCSAAAMLERGLQELKAAHKDASSWTAQLLEDLFGADDVSALDGFIADARKARSDGALTPLLGLRQRRLYKALSTTVEQELTPDQVDAINATYRGPRGATNRLNSIRLLEGDFGLPVGSIAMYCPDKAMNAKIARVRVHVNGAIDELEEWDKKYHDDLTGGHLRAQLHRFQRLWRVNLVIRPEVLAELSAEMISLLRQAIHECVLGLTLSEESVDAASRRLAVAIANLKGSPYATKKLADQPRLAAMNRDDTARFYPSGAPSLKLHFID